jgi:protein-S-isoprenylcysteine O-methyltransferase Ste14
MLVWINLMVLFFSTILLTTFYILSVGPAAREKIIGPTAYSICAKYRKISGMFKGVITVNMVLFSIYPLPEPGPAHFPWPWWVSNLIGLAIGIPAFTLMMISEKHAGEEVLTPKKEHGRYGRIYRKIHHPQAAGEVWLFPAIALLLHSPFLVIFSLVYFPCFLLFCWAEDKDLILRFGDPIVEYIRNTPAFLPKRD